MNPASDRFDARRWRREIAERIDRRSLIGAVLFALAIMAWGFFNFLLMPFTMALASALTLWYVTSTMAVLLLFAAASVAVTHGCPAWLAYPSALVIAVAGNYVLGLTLLSLLAPSSPKDILLGHTIFSVVLFTVAATLYVPASEAARHARLLRAAEAERTEEAGRLMEERLNAQLASIDHDLVIASMRGALELQDPEQRNALLECVSEYLRACQLRGGADADAIASTLAELRRACAAAATVAGASGGGEPARGAVA
jgi:hypothetical protein